MAASNDTCEIFNTLSAKITQLLFGRTKNDRGVINKTLDELNSINYKYTVVTNPTKAVLLVNQCCTLIPPEDLELVVKCCYLITSLVTRQSVVIDGRTLTVAVLWCLQALQGKNTDADILVALDALLRANSKHDLLSEIVKNPTLMNLSKCKTNSEVAFFALQCLEACTIPSEDSKNTDVDKFAAEYQTCFEIFLNHVVQNTTNNDKLISIKTYIVCLRGLQNIIRQNTDLLSDNFGIILGVIKSYMLLGINEMEFVTPQKLMPSSLSIPEITKNVSKEKGGKMTKHRKPKTQPALLKTRKTEKWDDDTSGYTPVSATICAEEGYSGLSGGVKTSDSDFSDTEGGNLAKLSVMAGRVRQAALSLFLHAVKLTDKTVMFSYWTSFVPENPLSGKHNLISCILKETSNRGRMVALNALLVLLSSSKLFLAQAEKGENLPFTPFSVILGMTIGELHKCLNLALGERSIPVLVMVLKCLAALVQATPYHRLAPGLVTKVVRNVKPFVYHKDFTVQVTALVVLGCVLASEPLIPETKDAFIKHANREERTKKVVSDRSVDSFDFAEFSSDEDDVAKDEIPWLLERCLFNLGVSCGRVEVVENTIPTPVKLEYLQLISVTSRNHFEEFLAPHLRLVTQALDTSLCSKHADVQLHAGRAVEFMGQAMNRCLGNDIDKVLSVNRCLPFWQTLLNGSLTALLQNEQHHLLRAVGCDCLGSIGPDAFEGLPRDKQILCVTLLFSCSHDKESGVRGAAVRALGIFVLYPSLREDPGFVVDTAETIVRVLQDENFTSRVKCSWALGNLSDALVLNKSNQHLIEEFPESMILKLLKMTNNASHDSDKIKTNTVRALGNILQLIERDLLKETQFKEAVAEGINILVKICTSGSNMKVRWNCCYAIGNAMKNPFLFQMTDDWQEKVFNALSDLVMNFRNFKVRINAAVALACPKKREFYRQFYQPIWISLVRGLETSQNMEDFNEYKHRDNLIEQICLTLGHLITLLTKDDLLPLKDSIHSDHLSVQMRKVWERLLPERSTVLFDARTYVSSLTNSSDLNAEQKDILQFLADILRHQF